MEFSSSQDASRQREVTCRIESQSYLPRGTSDIPAFTTAESW